ncbi:DNA repair and recombination protein RadB [Candidatus Woesearchaeota archaeon]|nr:DNA repair and recombination protein RadB [Candidatus Woesearchaeota archaeon]
MPKLSTGIVFLDLLLNGGYDDDIVTTIYGPSGSGKTNFCLIAAVKVAESGKKVLFLDTEGGIAVERIKQISSDFNYILPKMIFFSPTNFEEQKEVFETIRSLATEQVGLIVVDSISMLYRLELGKNEEVYDVNAALGRQLAFLIEIARRRKIPVLLTAQVYSEFDNRDQVKVVGGDLLKYSSKCLIELVKLANARGIVLRKHRSLPEGLEARFRIVGKGIEEVR